MIRVSTDAREHNFMQRLLKFLVVGTGGFVVDFSTMWALLTFPHLRPIAARVVAFAVAIVFTYVFNRAFTFADRPRRGRAEWLSYALVSAAAAVVNLGVFVVALRTVGGNAYSPYIAMPIGVAAGMVVNFIC